ncbi:MFS transporter [Streptomyces sp. NPDC048737]|uniref:MFS transporter n=1 Tax=unclassified Streptomyces TaxID=2593676 RepID=UPI0034477833
MLRPTALGHHRRVRDARAALTCVFLTGGVLFGSWASRIPDVKERTGVGTAGLGVCLWAMAAGALLAKAAAGPLVTRHGSAPLCRLGVLPACASPTLLALADDPWTLGAALTVFGVLLGVTDVAMNAQGVEVGRAAGRSVMSSLHAAYSLGGLTGAAAGAWFAAHGVTCTVHFASVGAVLGAANLAAGRVLLGRSGNPPGPSGPPDRAVPPSPPARRAPVVLLALACLCGLAAEGVSADWAAVHLHEDLGSSTGYAALGYAAYSAAMAAARLGGDRLTARWGSLRSAAWGAAGAAVLFAGALASARPAAAVAGFAVLGIGLSLVVPAAVETAGHLDGRASARAIAAVTAVGGVGFLAGPPVIGTLARVWGLPAALYLVPLLALVAAGLLQAVRHAHGPPRSAPVTPPAEATAPPPRNPGRRTGRRRRHR